MAAAIGAVRDTLPVRFRDAEFGPELGRRVKSLSAIPRAAGLVGQSVILTGDSSAGKSSLAAALLVENARRMIGPFVDDEEPGDSWRWEEARRCSYAQEIQIAGSRLRHQLSAGDPPLLVRSLRAPVLVLDDLGSHSRPSEEILLLVYQRMDNAEPTVFCTTLPRDEMAVRYGEGFARRLFEDCHVVEMNP